MLNIEWAGDHPFFLVVHPKGEEATGIDLDFRGWSTINADLMRKPGDWYLFRKGDEFPCLRVHVLPGEQPYYVGKHVGMFGFTGDAGQREIIAFGIGKKRLDGSVMRLWVLPNGTVCGGEDVDDIGVILAREMTPVPLVEEPLPVPGEDPLVIEGEATSLE